MASQARVQAATSRPPAATGAARHARTLTCAAGRFIHKDAGLAAGDLRVTRRFMRVNRVPIRWQVVAVGQVQG
jgi:hypothetical protein